MLRVLSYQNCVLTTEEASSHVPCHSAFLFRLSPFLLLLVTFLSACQSKPTTTLTEQRRQQLRPATVQVLQQAQHSQTQGHLVQALVWADSAAKLAPALSDVHLLRGQLLTDLRQYQTAVEAFEEALMYDPEYRVAAFHLGNLAYQREQYEEALRQYYRTLGIDAIQAGAVQASDLAKSLDTEAQLATLVQVGRTFRRLGDISQAYAAYHLALSIDSTHTVTLGDLSVVHRDDGDIEQALHYIRQAHAQDSTNIDYQFILGSSLVLAGNYEEALPPLHAVLDRRPWQAGIHYNLGQALLRLGQVEEGQRYLALADSVQPRNAEVRRLEILAERRPDLPERWIQLANAYQSANRYGEAIRAYQTVLPAVPTNEEVWFRLAETYILNKNVRGARHALERVLALAPSHERAAALLATL